jgi:hypothetical protein
MSTDTRQRGEITKMMDLREAKLCLDEFRVSLEATSAMIKPNVAKGELYEYVEEANRSLNVVLGMHAKEALILSILVQRRLTAILVKAQGFPDACNDVLVALNELQLAINKATEAQARYEQKAAPIRSSLPLAIEKFKRDNGRMTTEQAAAFDRKVAEHDREAAALNADKEQPEKANPLKLAIYGFKHQHGLMMTEQEREEYDRLKMIKPTE